MTMAAPQISQEVLLNKESPELEEEKACFECHNFNLYYDTVHSLKSINLTIPEKRVTAFIGPSGCGKSTLLRCMNRMNDLIDIVRIEGQMLLNGDDIYKKSVNVAELRRKVGMVFQKPNPFPKTVYENIAYGLRLQGVNKKRILDERVEWALKGAALWDEVKDRLHTLGTQLSGGQQQLVGVARAIVGQPKLLLADEPTGNLHTKQGQVIMELFKELNAEGMTIIQVTHSDENAKYGNRVVQLVDGMIKSDEKSLKEVQ